MNCLSCGIEFEGRKDAKFCSPKCRVTFNRKQGVVTDNVTFSNADVTDNFSFTISIAPHNPPDVVEAKSKLRTAKYWYDVPLAAVPILQKGWPSMPGYMNGRQYFLWWQNEFKLTEAGTPIIHNPFPKRDNPINVPAGPESRRWGA